MLYNPTEATRKLANWKKALPWIKPHYAIKSNPYEGMVSDILGNGAGADCASKEEIELCLGMGAKKDSIVYSNSIKN